MKRHAVIDSEGNVVNVVLWDGASMWRPPEGHTLVEVEETPCGPGWTYADGVFTEPPPPPAPEPAPEPTPETPAQ